jgi:hypothetical protein
MGFLRECSSIEQDAYSHPLIAPLMPLVKSTNVSFEAAEQALCDYHDAKRAMEAQPVEARPAFNCTSWVPLEPSLAPPRVAMLIILPDKVEGGVAAALDDKKAFARKQGYDLHLVPNGVKGRSKHWSKLPAVLMLLPHYDWVSIE